MQMGCWAWMCCCFGWLGEAEVRYCTFSRGSGHGLWEGWCGVADGEVACDGELAVANHRRPPAVDCGSSLICWGQGDGPLAFADRRVEWKLNVVGDGLLANGMAGRVCFALAWRLSD